MTTAIIIRQKSSANKGGEVSPRRSSTPASRSDFKKERYVARYIAQINY
ncbi:hypothetical protein [Leptothermofonsia sp. ETS-13]